MNIQAAKTNQEGLKALGKVYQTGEKNKTQNPCNRNPQSKGKVSFYLPLKTERTNYMSNRIVFQRPKTLPTPLQIHRQ